MNPPVSGESEPGPAARRPALNRRDLPWVAVGVVAFLVVAGWPPPGERSLAMKFVNWVVDPSDRLPVLPPDLPLGLGDDPDAVEAHDAEARFYDEMYQRGGWLRRRLELKVMGEPFDPSTTRQVLTLVAVLTGLYAWRLGTRKG